jgi:hypothetical protein
VQREEQKECAELIEKLQAERDRCDAAQKKAFEKLEKDSVRDLAAAQKNGAAIRAKSEKRVASYTKEAHATLASEQAKEAKRFKKELAERCVKFYNSRFCVLGFVSLGL